MEFFLLDQNQKDLVTEIEKCFHEVILSHTAYQIKHFIIGQFLTPDRMHRQAVRELYSRFNGLVEFHYEHQKLQLEKQKFALKIRKLERERQTLTDDIRKEEIDIEIKETELELDRKKWAEMNLKKSLSETIREMKVFKEELDYLGTQRKYETYEDAEPEYWEKQYLNLRLQGKAAEGLPPLPENQKIEIEKSLRRQIESFKTKEFIENKKKGGLR